MSDKKPKWMIEEEARAETLANRGETVNDIAPRLVRVTKEPPRMQKAFYIQRKYAEVFEDLIHKQKKIKGKNGPKLAEEALKMLLEKYGEDTSTL